MIKITKDYALALCASHYFITFSPDDSDIATVLGVTVNRIHEIADTPDWVEALDFWGYPNLDAKPNLNMYSAFKWNLKKHPNGKTTRQNHREFRKFKKERKSLQKETLYREQGGYCNGCRESLPIRQLTFDHIHPRSKGGGMNFKNLQLLCPQCNNDKGNKSQAEFIAMLEAQGIRRKKPTFTRELFDLVHRHLRFVLMCSSEVMFAFSLFV